MGDVVRASVVSVSSSTGSSNGPRKRSKSEILDAYTVVEPYLFLFLVAMSMRIVVTSKLMQHKACVVNLGHNVSYCKELEDEEDSDALKESQKIATTYNLIASVASTIPMVIVGLFVGTFCDRYGRKIPLILAPIGPIISNICILACVQYFDSPLIYVVLAQIPTGIFGGMLVAMAGGNSHIAHEAFENERKFRFACLDGVLMMGMITGTTIGGALYKQFGYIPVYTISSAFAIISMFWISLRMRKNNKLEMKNMTYAQIAKALLSTDGLKTSFKTVSQKRPGNARLQVGLLLLCMCLCTLVMVGPMGIAFYFAEYMYKWKVDTFSYVTTISRVIQAVVMIPAVVLLKTCGHMITDVALALIGAVSGGSENIIRAFAYKPWVYYIAFLPGSIMSLSRVGIRSRFAQIVGEAEVGKMFVFLTIGETVTPVLGSAIFNPLYNATVDHFAGAVYFFSGCIMMIAGAILVWIFIFGTEPPIKDRNKQTEDNNVPQRASSVSFSKELSISQND